MRWVKRGVVIEPPTHLPWVDSHAAVPHAEALDDGRVRVYFTARDAQRRSHVAAADLDLEDPGGVEFRPDPLLAPGPAGAFDDSGAMTSCLVRHRSREYLYYQGWSLGVTVPFHVFVGCAVRDDPDDAFERVSAAPVLGPHHVDPYLCASPWVLVEDDRWRMWYVSGLGWTFPDGEPRYRVHVKYAESRTGLDWERTGHVCVDFDGPDEYAVARPVVVRDGDVYRMWYSHRGSSYRIGYAESRDGLEWERLDGDAGIDVSPTGWDSEMVEYGCVFDAGGRRHMLYNGNGFGSTGIGLATLETDLGQPFSLRP